MVKYARKIFRTNPCSALLIARIFSKVYQISGASAFLYVANHTWLLQCLTTSNNAEKQWTQRFSAIAFSQKFFSEVFLRSLPRGEFLCEALHHWSATANTEKPLVTTSESAQLHQSLTFSASVEGEKLLGEWILLLPLNLTGFCFLMQKKSYSSDEIGFWGVSSYWRNAFHVPGQVPLAYPYPIQSNTLLSTIDFVPNCMFSAKQIWSLVPMSVLHRVTCNLEILGSFSRLQNLELWGGSFFLDSLNTLLIKLGPRLVRIHTADDDHLDAVGQGGILKIIPTTL